MTPREKQELDRATAKAKAANLRVVVGKVKGTDRPAFAVPSQSRPNFWHIVTVEGDRLRCDCEAGRKGKICCHRGAVHLFLTDGLRAATMAEPAHETAPVVRRQTRISMFKE